MDIEIFRNYCIEKPGVTESFPFDSQTLVFKVGGKMFALSDVEHFNSVNLKCDPELAVQLRERFSAVTPGYHMNKTHWNTVLCDGSVSDPLIFEWIDHSYQLVFNSLPKKIKETITS
jgi:predicted DNA-binding protein (MmcQ/YjbR family)